MTLNLLKRAEKGAPLSATDYDNNLTQMEDDLKTTLKSSISVTVGSGGDYSTVNAAIEALTQAYAPTYNKSGIRATITMLSGYSMNEQFIFDGIDCSWITLTSADAEVPVVASAITTAVEGEYSAIVATNGGKSCHLDFIGNMDASASGKNGLYVSRGGVIHGRSIGIKNTTRHGSYCYGSGTIASLNSIDNSGATSISCLISGGGLISCYGTMNNTGAGTNGATSVGGGSISCRLSMDNRKGTSDTSTDTRVEDGGYISRGGGTGGANQATGTITANGYISQ